ncbi:hypothetical protein AAGQ96_03150 [Pantoea sp. MBD-2R]|uniref:hypothetical protein n=1 Tax=Pantoea sp. MBD-2R TaxID=3141540 RepID=UPI00318347D3
MPVLVKPAEFADRTRTHRALARGRYLLPWRRALARGRCLLPWRRALARGHCLLPWRRALARGAWAVQKDAKSGIPASSTRAVHGP